MTGGPPPPEASSATAPAAAASPAGSPAAASGPVGPPDGPGELRRGTAYGFLAYGIWGLFPLYFAALAPGRARSRCSPTASCGRSPSVRWSSSSGATSPGSGAFARRPRLVAGITLAGLLIAANWTVYVLAVLTGRTYEAALGYFLNPIVTVALGVLVLRERLRVGQWVAVGIGAVAAVYLTVAGGVVPWIPLALAFSFGLYGLTKKKVGATLAAMHSLAAETTVLAPVAVVVLVVLAARDATTFTGHGPWHTSLLVLSGVVTAVPLLLFAAAARRIPLVTVGLIQFVTPMLQLLVGVALLGEHVSVGCGSASASSGWPSSSSPGTQCARPGRPAPTPGGRGDRRRRARRGRRALPLRVGCSGGRPGSRLGTRRRPRLSHRGGGGRGRW